MRNRQICSPITFAAYACRNVIQEWKRKWDSEYRGILKFRLEKVDKDQLRRHRDYLKGEVLRYVAYAKEHGWELEFVKDVPGWLK